MKKLSSRIMAGEKETPRREREARSFPWRGLLLWPFVILLIYLLSLGPVWKFLKRASVPNASSVVGTVLKGIYWPWGWVYLHTPLRKPLGLYMHVWAPDDFDAKGEVRFLK